MYTTTSCLSMIVLLMMITPPTHLNNMVYLHNWILDQEQEMVILLFGDEHFWWWHFYVMLYPLINSLFHTSLSFTLNSQNLHDYNWLNCILHKSTVIQGMWSAGQDTINPVLEFRFCSRREIIIQEVKD